MSARMHRERLPQSIPPPVPPSHTRATAVTRLPHATGLQPHASRMPHACQPQHRGEGVDLRRAADVLIHPPVPKKKAKWRIRGCGAHAVARGHRASDRTLCAPNGVLRGLVKVCQANLRGWGIVSVLSGQSEAQCGGAVVRWAHLWKQRLCAVCFKRKVWFP